MKRRKGLGIVVILLIVALIIFLFGGILSFIFIGSNIGGKLDKATGEFASGVCANINDPYKTTFQNAGSKYGVQPAFVGAIFVGEHRSVADSNYESWPSAKGPWASSPKGANGPFQFIPGTWNAYQEDGDGDGDKDVQDLTDAAFGAAKYLSKSGAGNNTVDEASLRDAASRYNSGKPWAIGQTFKETNPYVERVITAFNVFYCPGGQPTKVAGVASIPSTNGLAAPTKNFGQYLPLRVHHKGYAQAVAVDIGMKTGTELFSIIDGRVISAFVDAPGNDCGNGVKVRGREGQFIGLDVTYCHLEERPRVSQGDQVRAGQQIGISGNTGRSTGPHLHLQGVGGFLDNYPRPNGTKDSAREQAWRQFLTNLPK